MNSDVGDSHLPELRVAFWALWMIPLPRTQSHKVTKPPGPGLGRAAKMAKSRYEKSFTTAIHAQTSYRHGVKC